MKWPWTKTKEEMEATIILLKGELEDLEKIPKKTGEILAKMGAKNNKISKLRRKLSKLQD
jgi:prefoldin subunit 5